MNIYVPGWIKNYIFMRPKGAYRRQPVRSSGRTGVRASALCPTIISRTAGPISMKFGMMICIKEGKKWKGFQMCPTPWGVRGANFGFWGSESCPIIIWRTNCPISMKFCMIVLSMNAKKWKGFEVCRTPWGVRGAKFGFLAGGQNLVRSLS